TRALEPLIIVELTVGVDDEKDRVSNMLVLWISADEELESFDRLFQVSLFVPAVRDVECGGARSRSGPGRAQPLLTDFTQPAARTNFIDHRELIGFAERLCIGFDRRFLKSARAFLEPRISGKKFVLHSRAH